MLHYHAYFFGIQGGNSLEDSEFLYQLDKQFPNSWVLTLCASKFELGTINQISDVLANIHPALRVLYQSTLVNELDWHANASLAQCEQVSAVTTLQWVVEGLGCEGLPAFATSKSGICRHQP